MQQYFNMLFINVYLNIKSFIKDKKQGDSCQGLTFTENDLKSKKFILTNVKS